MAHDFNEVINRRGTNSVKYDFHEKYGKPTDAIPMWIADMDFRVPDVVKTVLVESAEHGIFGYTETKSDYFNAVAGWFQKIHGYHVKEEWMVKAPGVVFAMAMAIKAFTSPGDAVISQKPLYPPIEEIINANKRVSINNPLKYSENRYTVDIDDFEQKIIRHNIKMFILCNPHNPVGRVWTKAELLEMGHICKKHGVVVVSDEIHCDIVFEGHKHIAFPTVADDFGDMSIVCTAPSKTFNLAGLQAANIFISNPELREGFKREIVASGYAQLNVMGLAACQKAYEHGGEWYAELMTYLARNKAYVKNFLTKTPEVRFIELEGTYLGWLDMNAFGVRHDKLEERLNRAGIWFSNGKAFGDAGAGFFRINLACPLATLEMAMEKLVKGLDLK